MSLVPQLLTIERIFTNKLRTIHLGNSVSDAHPSLNTPTKSMTLNAFTRPDLDDYELWRFPYSPIARFLIGRIY
jgi:hypothetical protein